MQKAEKVLDIMLAMRRKTLAVCLECHNNIHSGKYDGKRFVNANVG